ncbi:MAG TPA: hypothetical protein VG297_04455 [Bryobacteraceae bacterium]|jgi:hypothetical protein|nr:hypothetical protein [Bryobacteraceae bacterium]
MAAEFDNNILSGLLKTGIEISIGAASKSLEMVSNPAKSISEVVSSVSSMLTVPEETGPGLPDKAQALAGVWLKQGLSLMAELQAAGEKITKGK